MKSTIVRRNLPISSELDNSDIHPVLKRVYANREISSLSELDYKLDQLLDFHSLKDIEVAAENIAESIFNNKTIVVIGDYDADGATSTALIVKSLRAFGHKKLHYIVPSRFEFGYGLSPGIVDVAAKLNPDLIITVDNGISSIEGVRRAIDYNIRVVVTDHHIAGDELPDAVAIVNPNQNMCDFPSKCIAGVGVAFYTMLALRSYLKDRDWFKGEDVPNMAVMLDLVALGTVADVVTLDRNNRIMVEYGLQRIRRGLCSSGLSEILNVSNKERSSCTSTDLAFYVAPRLNAAGRLEDMSQGIECLLSDDDFSARNIASQLHTLNSKRRDIEQGMLESAYEKLDLEQYDQGGNNLPAALCIYNEKWHQGVIGLLASRVKEKFYRPVIAFADGGDKVIKGSARSIPGLHIRDVLDEVSANNKGLILKFGGHAMAAGLSINKEDFSTFSAQFLAVVVNRLSKEDLEKIVFSDGSIAADELNIVSAEALQFAGPWGQGFPEPIFDDVFEIVSWKIVGAKHLKFELRREEADLIIDAIAFNCSDMDLPNYSSRIHVSYRLSVNEFRGNRTAQLIIDTIDAV